MSVVKIVKFGTLLKGSSKNCPHGSCQKLAAFS